MRGDGREIEVKNKHEIQFSKVSVDSRRKRYEERGVLQRVKPYKLIPDNDSAIDRPFLNGRVQRMPPSPTPLVLVTKEKTGAGHAAIVTAYAMVYCSGGR